jgi:hypothetical protein
VRGFSALPGGNPIGYTFMKVGRAHDRLYFAELQIFPNSIADTRESDGDAAAF